MVIDTMVFAYAAFRTTPFHHEAHTALMRVSDASVPESFLAEFANVAWLKVRHEGVPVAKALAAYDDVMLLRPRIEPIAPLWKNAVEAAVVADHSPYDTLFVALAEQEGTELVTYDAKLLAAFPRVAISPAEFLARP